MKKIRRHSPLRLQANGDCSGTPTSSRSERRISGATINFEFSDALAIGCFRIFSHGVRLINEINVCESAGASEDN